MRFTAICLIFIFSSSLAYADSWYDKFDFKSDARLRHEGISKENSSYKDRMRIRARAGFKVEVQENVDFIFQLATGGKNPVSTNQTLDGSFSTKDIGIDLAYIDWKINNNVDVNAGKMKNPMFRVGGAPLIWDGDLNPEGIAAKFKSDKIFGTAAVFSVAEGESDDYSLLYTFQTGLKFDISDNGSLTTGLSYFGYTKTIGLSPFYNGDPKGNSFEGTAEGDFLYKYGYKNIEFFSQYDTQLKGLPLRFHIQYTKNNEVEDQDVAYSYGVTLGSVKKKGDKQYAWLYQDIQADSVIATFNDSDFGGGGTDSKGHVFKAKYGFSEKIALGGTFFFNKIDRFQGAERDYQRFQIDLEFKIN